MAVITKGKLTAWIAISVALQLSALIYINNYFLSGGGSIKDQVVDVFNERKTPNRVDVSYKIPAQASEIKVSYDGAYLSYILNDKIEIVELAKKAVKKTLSLAKLMVAQFFTL